MFLRKFQIFCFCFSIATVSDLDQRYLLLPPQVKDCYLVHLLQNFVESKSIVIFTQTCRSCQVLANLLKKLELKCVCLHSVMAQKDRLSSLGRFKSGLVNILVATDVASRGLDIPLVGLVINYNVPVTPKDYIHRVGRTARAGRGGLALTLLIQHDIKRLLEIEKYVNVEMGKFETNESDALKLLKIVSVTKREVELRLNDSNFGEKRKINKRKLTLLNGTSFVGNMKKKRR